MRASVKVALLALLAALLVLAVGIIETQAQTTSAVAKTSTRRTRTRTTKTRTTKSKTKTTKVPYFRPPKNKKDIAVAIYDIDNFCLMFPDNPSRGIGEEEQSSHTMCTPKLAAFLGRPKIPSNFLISKHFAKKRGGGSNYTQITGLFNLNARFNGQKLNTEDGGGQYDSHGVPDPNYPKDLGSPHGSICSGWDQYVHIWQEDRNPRPGVGKICIRCCSGPRASQDCNWRDSAAGCEPIIPGDYSG